MRHLPNDGGGLADLLQNFVPRAASHRRARPTNAQQVSRVRGRQAGSFEVVAPHGQLKQMYRDNLTSLRKVAEGARRFQRTKDTYTVARQENGPLKALMISSGAGEKLV